MPGIELLVDFEPEPDRDPTGQRQGQHQGFALHGQVELVIEVQEDAISPGQRVVVVDDLIATGGTMQAAIELVTQRGGIVVAAVCIIELSFLKGRERLGVPLTAMVTYDS